MSLIELSSFSLSIFFMTSCKTVSKPASCSSGGGFSSMVEGAFNSVAATSSKNEWPSVVGVNDSGG